MLIERFERPAILFPKTINGRDYFLLDEFAFRRLATTTSRRDLKKLDQFKLTTGAKYYEGKFVGYSGLDKDGNLLLIAKPSFVGTLGPELYTVIEISPLRILGGMKFRTLKVRESTLSDLQFDGDVNISLAFLNKCELVGFDSIWDNKPSLPLKP